MSNSGPVETRALFSSPPFHFQSVFVLFFFTCCSLQSPIYSIRPFPVRRIYLFRCWKGRSALDGFRINPPINTKCSVSAVLDLCANFHLPEASWQFELTGQARTRVDHQSRSLHLYPPSAVLDTSELSPSYPAIQHTQGEWTLCRSIRARSTQRDCRSAVRTPAACDFCFLLLLLSFSFLPSLTFSSFLVSVSFNFFFFFFSEGG